MHTNESVGHICPCCAERRYQETQKHVDEAIKHASLVQLAFTQDDITEHMWVQLTHVNFEERMFIGYLVNEPTKLKDIPINSIITADFSDIEQLH